MNEVLTAARLRHLFRYNPETGIFTRNVSVSAELKGSLAGTRSAKGYLDIAIDRKSYRVHRLAWLYMTGFWPTAQVDHINRDRSDNRWANLREASNAENAQNRSKNSNNSSGHTGVVWDKGSGKWRAQIKKDWKLRYLGVFDSVEEAAEAYISAKAALHNFNPKV